MMYPMIRQSHPVHGLSLSLYRSTIPPMFLAPTSLSVLFVCEDEQFDCFEGGICDENEGKSEKVELCGAH